MARGRVAVEVEASGGLEDAVKLKEAVGHHDEVGHHVAFLEEPSEGLDHFGNVGVLLSKKFAELPFRLLSPVPGILEGGYLRVGFMPFRRL